MFFGDISQTDAQGQYLFREVISEVVWRYEMEKRETSESVPPLQATEPSSRVGDAQNELPRDKGSAEFVTQL